MYSREHFVIHCCIFLRIENFPKVLNKLLTITFVSKDFIVETDQSNF